ncbi:hypothetical protein N9A45_01715 [bacterium]|nr:hypothetical protein [bacterium]
MDASQVSGVLPTRQERMHMSYMYGPQMNGTSIYFGGDDRVVLQATAKPYAPPPAWLVADWMLAHNRGEPIPEMARTALRQRSQWNEGLLWLRDYLDQ